MLVSQTLSVLWGSMSRRRRIVLQLIDTIVNSKTVKYNNL